jgi:hypothetical protein
MTTDQYIQYQKQFLLNERSSKAAAAKEKVTIKNDKIKRDRATYGRECYGFRCLSEEQQTDFILERLDFTKLGDVIRHAKDTEARMVLLGDFHDSASKFAIHPDIIVFVKTFTDNNITTTVECSPTEARTPMPGPVAKATYANTWLSEKCMRVYTTEEETVIPDPLCLYESGQVYDQLTPDQRRKHIGNIHLNITRHIYLGIPTTTPNHVSQSGQSHSAAMEIPPLDHRPGNYATYFEEYNRERINSYYDETNPIQDQASAEEYLNNTLEAAHEQRALVILLPDRGSSSRIKTNLEEAIKKHVHNISWLYQEVFMQAVTLEAAILCAQFPGTLWSSGVCLAQDPRGTAPVQDYAATLTRAKEPAFNNDLQTQELLHHILQSKREVLRYETLLHVITLALKSLIQAHNRLLYYICMPFDQVINENYAKDDNYTRIHMAQDSVHVEKLRTATAALVYYAL